MDNIHVTQSPTKQRDSGYMNSSNMNSFNIKNLDTAEKGAGGGQSSGTGLSLSVPVIIFLGILSVIGIFIIIAALISSIHRVHEGNVALYYRNGALLPDYSGPGVHTCTPFVTTVLQVISAIENDKVYSLVSKFGDHMKKVLIYDRIAQGIQDFCANNSIDEVYNSRFVDLSQTVLESLSIAMAKLSDSGLNILNLFIPKPDIPPAIAANYREVKIEWTRQLVAQQKQKTEKINKETVLQNEVMDAERKKEVGRIRNEQVQRYKEHEKIISTINNTINTDKENTLTDIQSYRSKSSAKDNEALLTDQYIKLQMTKGLLANTKIYFSGQDSALGSLFSNILKLDNSSG